MMHLFLPLLAPLILLATALVASRTPGLRPGNLPKLAEIAALGAFVVAILSAVALWANGPGTSDLIGVAGIGISVRLDAVSAIMLLLVSFIGWIVMRFSATYMDGEARQGAFVGWMSTALASVLLLVMSGNLVQVLFAWAATSLALNQLLLFYPERTTAVRAARKRR